MFYTQLPVEYWGNVFVQFLPINWCKNYGNALAFMGVMSWEIQNV